MLIQLLLVFNAITATEPGESLPTRTARVLIPLLHHTSQVCNACLVNDELNDEIAQDFIREFWTAVDSVALIHGSSDVIGNLVQIKCHLYIILLSNHERYGNTLTRLVAGSSWNLYAKFVFYTSCSHFSRHLITAAIKSYSKEVLELGLLRAVLVYHLTESDEVRVFHIVPFQKKLNFGLDIQDTVTMLTTSNLRNIQKHPIRASSVYEFSKKEVGTSLKAPYIHLLNSLAEQLNGTAKWVRPSSDDLLNTVKSMFYKREINILFLAKAKTKQTTDISIPVIRSDCFMIPERKIESFFKFMHVPFSLPVWITLLVIVTTCCLISRLLRKQFPRNVMLQVLFGASVPDYQMKRSERFTCFTLTVLLFFLSESYLTLMITVILNNEYYPHMNTLEDLLRSEVKIFVTPAIRRFLQHNYPEYITKTIPSSDGDNAINSPDLAILAFRDLGKLYVRSVNNFDPQTNARKYYILPETFEWNILQHTVSRNEPLGAELQSLQVHLIESGIWNLWNSWNQDKFTHKTAQFAARMLRFGDLISMWYILAYGFSVGGICFMMEWVVYWSNRRKGVSSTVKRGNIDDA